MLKRCFLYYQPAVHFVTLIIYATINSSIKTWPFNMSVCPQFVTIDVSSGGLHNNSMNNGYKVVNIWQ